MKISDLDQPRIGDIVEFETDPDTVVEGVIVGETEDGYIYEFSESGYIELHETCTYGKYYCSTDKKYKCRQSPKQSRDVSEGSLEEIDRRGFLKGMGAAAVAGAAGSVNAQSFSFANDELLGDSVSDAVQSVSSLRSMKSRFLSPVHRTKILGFAEEKLNEMLLAFIRETGISDIKKIAEQVNVTALKQANADPEPGFGDRFQSQMDPVAPGLNNMAAKEAADQVGNFLLYYKRGLGYYYKKIKNPESINQHQEPQKAAPHEIKLNLKSDRKVGDIVTVRSGPHEGKRVKVTQILGPNKEGKGNKGLGVVVESVSEAPVDIGQEWMSDTELDQYVPDALEQEWRELVGYNIEGKAHPLWINITGDYEPDINDPQHRKWMVDVANKWFAMKKIPNIKFHDVKDATDELEWLVQVGEGVSEGEFRQDDVEEFVPSNSQLDDLKSQYLPDWEMLDHQTLQAKYVAKDHRHALEFAGFINELSENMDHFAEVTQDVAEVTVKTSTFDVDGLTILDFQLAMMVDDYAEKNDIEQVRMQGNFGMHEEKQRLDPKCWKGYKKQGTKMKGGIRVNNCVPESAGYVAKNTKEAQDPRFSSSITADVGTDTMRKQLADFFPTEAPADGQQQIREAEYQGREVPLGRPMRGDVKKFKVYVRDPKSGKVKKINFGHGGTSAKRLGQKTMRIKKSNPARRRNFRARHRCNTAKNRMTARYWSCRAW